FLFVGVILLVGAGYFFLDTLHDIVANARADGTVIDLITEPHEDDTYYPRVRFTTLTGEPLEFTSKFGTHPAAFGIGETVTVLYDPANPTVARIGSFLGLWAAPLGLVFMALVFSAIGLAGSSDESDEGIKIEADF